MSIKSDKYVHESDDSDEEDYSYTPPKHYKSITGKDVDLNGKQVWLIKYPKNLNVSNLPSLPINSNGSSILNIHENDESKDSSIDKMSKPFSYQISEEINGGNYQIFVNDSQKFKTKNIKIDRVYNIRESTVIPQIDLNKVKKPRKNVPVVKGLRMRHFPTGYSAEDYIEAQSSQKLDDEIIETDDQKQDTKDDKKHKKDKKDKKDKKEKRDKKDKKHKK